MGRWVLSSDVSAQDADRGRDHADRAAHAIVKFTDFPVAAEAATQRFRIWRNCGLRNRIVIALTVFALVLVPCGKIVSAHAKIAAAMLAAADFASVDLDQRNGAAAAIDVQDDGKPACNKTCKAWQGVVPRKEDGFGGACPAFSRRAFHNDFRTAKAAPAVRRPGCAQPARARRHGVLPRLRHDIALPQLISRHR